MLKIKKIEFLKVLYDDSIAQNIFSIANIDFSNSPSIHGALLYWQKNATEEPYTKEGDYKFYYDMANTQYFAAVKFPKDCKLTRDQRQELAFILLEERGSIGTYSFLSSKPKIQFHLKEEYDKLDFPANFDLAHFNYDEICQQIDSMDEMIFERLPYDRAFIEHYIAWLRIAIKEHHSKLISYLDKIPFSYLCYVNPLLSEQFLIDYLEFVDLEALQYNKSVLARLSSAFKRNMINELQSANKSIHSDFGEQLDDFIESDAFYQSYDIVYLPESEETVEMDLQFFEYDRAMYKWPGSEHLVKGIPSLASQKYDRYGDKRLTNAEMDKKLGNYSSKQLQLYSANAELHWLHRYRDRLDWQIICRDNVHLNEEFLSAHLNEIDFQALGLNTNIALQLDFLTKHFSRFNHKKPVPLLICHLTEQFYLSHKDEMKIDIDVLYKYIDVIDEEEFNRIESYLID